MRRVAITVAVAVLALVFVGLLARSIWLLDGPRVVADATAPNGVRFVVVQSCNWGAEPFTSRAYVRGTNGQWRDYYLGHQDSLWLRGKFTSDTSHHRLTVWQDQRPRATADWETGSYSLGDRAGDTRDGTPKPVGWDLFRHGRLRR